MGRKICPLCLHYDTCKFWETVFELKKSLAVEWWNAAKFWKWQQRFASLCMFWKFDEVSLDHIPEALDFLFHDFVVQSSCQSPSSSRKTTSSNKKDGNDY